MMITVEITADETFNKFKKHKFGYLGGRDFAVSDDGTNWEVINHYPDLSLTDPNTALIGDYYYIASDNGIWKTKDFNTFTKINATISDSKHTDLHSFEWFQDLNGSWFIKYNATAPNGGVYSYWADFDETTDSFVDTVDQFNLPIGDASGLVEVRGNYYIWMSGDKLYKATDFKGQFKEIATDIAGNAAHKQFSIVVSDNYLYVYFIADDKTYMRSSKTTNLIHWSKPVEVVNVGLGSYFFNANAVTVYPSYKRERTFDKVLKVTANGFKQTVPISCMVFSSLQVHWEQNGTWQIDFTAYDDSSISYAMLAEEAEIVFNGQTFIVKQAVEDAGGGIDTKQITASHVYNEINRVRQRKTKTGTLTYTVNDVLSFYLDDKTANPLGFTYHVYGNFDKQQIENLGNSSGSDMISKILDQWPKAIIYPDNKEIQVYTPEAFEKDYGGRIDYLHNSSDVKMTVDSTTITNQVKVFGKQIENTNDNADDNAPVKYYFEPFIVSDKASINQYGLHPMDDISDERFTNKTKAAVFAKGQLSPYPAVSIEATMEDNEVPYAGEKRHLIAKPLNLETDLIVIGYTWYPFDNTQKNSLLFANLPASILKTQTNINNRIRMVQLMAQQAINAAKTGTRNFVSPTDPMKNDNNDIRTGDIWTLPLLDNKTKSLVRSVNVESEDDSDTNETIYTDPEKMDKINVQFSIWNGSQWLELSNQRTTNKLNDNINSVASQVQEAQAGIATAAQQAQDAVDKADKAITDAGFATDTANTAKQVADSAKEDVATAKSDSATALTNANTALDNAKTAQSTADTIKVDVDDVKGQLTSKADKTDIDAVTKRVTTNETNIMQNSTNIETKANQADVNTLTGRVTSAESSIIQNANNIKSKVSSSDVQGMLDNGGYATQTWTGSQIDQKADEINSTVTSVSNKVDNLQIDGVNLLLNSDQQFTNSRVGQEFVTTTFNLNDIFDKYGTDQVYTISYDLSSKDPSKVSWIQAYAYPGTTPQNKYSFPAVRHQGITTTPQRFSMTFKPTLVDKTITKTILVFYGEYDSGNIPIVNRIKVTLGNKGNIAWSPAPEDMATVTALSKVEQKADSISSTVTNNKSDADSQFTNINQTIGGIQSTVKNKADSSTVTQLSNLVDSKVSAEDYNSEITQLADDINLRVTKDGLISQINQQAGGNTLIQVSDGKGKLYLDASSVVFSGNTFIPSAAIASLSADKIDTSQFSLGAGSKYKIDMSGDKGILIEDNDKKWTVSINNGALYFAGSDNGQFEHMGGFDYTINVNDSNLNGFGAYIYSQQKLGIPYGGDFFAIGEATTITDNNNIIYDTDMIYAPIPNGTYLTGFTFNKEVFMNNDAQLVFTAGNTNTQPKLVFSGYKDISAGIYMDTYGNITGNTNAQQWWVKDKNLNTVLGADLNGNKQVYIGSIKFSGGSVYIGGSNGWWIRNENGSLATINAGNFAKGSTKESKKNIKNADIDKLATNIYNMDITTFNYKNDSSAARTNIGAVIGDGYHIDDSLLTKNEDAVMIDNVVFALVATAQKQAQQISELTTELTALKIKEQNNE